VRSKALSPRMQPMHPLMQPARPVLLPSMMAVHLEVTAFGLRAWLFMFCSSVV